MTVLAYADFMNACLPVSLMNGRSAVYSLAQVVVYCICLQPLTNSCQLYLSAASHKYLSTVSVCSLSQIVVYFICLQPLTSSYLLYLFAASHK